MDRSRPPPESDRPLLFGMAIHLSGLTQVSN